MAVRVKANKTPDYIPHYSVSVYEYCNFGSGGAWWEGVVVWNPEEYIHKATRVAKLKAPHRRGCVKARNEMVAALEPVAARMNSELAATGVRPDTGDVVCPAAAKRWKAAQKRKAAKAAALAAA